jgi:hypothetical protein
MKPEELRIGNYVTWADQDITTSDSVLTVIGIVLNDTIWLEWEWEDGTNDNTDCGLDSIKPIHITEQWIIDFGFISNAYMDRYEKRDLNFECYKGNGFVHLWIEKYSHIKYINQLQNLYYLMYNEELQLKQSTT